MILAAGVGLRLRPLTDQTPKALIEIAGTPILEIVIRRLIKAGVDGMVINLHHFPEKIKEFVVQKKNFGIKIQFSHEPELLDTGGGLKKTAKFFDDGEPFFLHNADVLSDIDLVKMCRFHAEKKALATLAVSHRESGRYLLFDREGLLVGRERTTEKRIEWAASPVDPVERLAFAGIHVISPAIFKNMTSEGAFSIIETYLKSAGQGKKVLAFNTNDCYWSDIGSAEKLQTARQHADQRGLRQ